jgi:hypothetical protein
MRLAHVCIGPLYHFPSGFSQAGRSLSKFEKPAQFFPFGWSVLRFHTG